MSSVFERAGIAPPQAAKFTGVCRKCGESFEARGGRQYYCGAVCCLADHRGKLRISAERLERLEQDVVSFIEEHPGCSKRDILRAVGTGEAVALAAQLAEASGRIYTRSGGVARKLEHYIA